jgi:hypothetical protein
LAQNLGIWIVCSHAYHPQSQGSIEVANRTFKRRLAALQLAHGVQTWVDQLPELALTINTTTSFGLPRNKTPFEVWFGRKPHWIGGQPTQPIQLGFFDLDEDEDNSDQDYNSSDQDDNSGNANLVLTEIETRVAVNNARIHAQMIRKNSGRSKEFNDGDIATLKIPTKLRLKTKAVRLLVWVLEHKNGQYKLQCQHGRLAGRYQGMHFLFLLPFLKLILIGGELNVVDNASIEILGSGIRIQPEKQRNTEVTISFANAVARENNRGSVSAA